MGSMNPVVVDVSSDEESDPRLDDFEWLTEVLQAVSEKSGSFDEVEVVSEVKGDSKSKHQKSKPLNSTVGDEEDDDDCVVLDGDPEKTTAAAETAVDDDDNAAESDEVLVVGQKGEIACRDFPHPRHSCAKYPFSSTSHEKYCDMCHCYVCDIRAPCPYWCVGVSSIDHCHANDKEDIWRNQREYFRTGKMPSRPVLKPPLARVPSMVTQVHSRNSTSSIIRLSPQTLPRSQVPGIQACSSSTGFPKVRSSRRIGQSRSILQNHGLQHRSVMLLSGVRNSVIQKSRGHYVGHLRSRVASSTSLIPETPQASGAGFLSKTGYAPLNDHNNIGNYCNTSQGLQCTHSSPLLAEADGWRDPYTQLGNRQQNMTGYFSTVPVPDPLSHVFTRHPDQNLSECGNHQIETNPDLFASAETRNPAVAAGSCHQTFQQLGTNNGSVQGKFLSEFEAWLMDNATAGVSPSAEPVGPEEGALTFDFETFLNN